MRKMLAMLGVVMAMVVGKGAFAADQGDAVGYLGIGLSDLTEAVGKDESAGAKVEHVDADSPAAKAGIKEGDVVLRFDGERVRSAAHLARLTRETPPERRASVEVLRGGTRQTLTVTLGERREDWSEWGRDLRDRLQAPLPDLRQWGRDMAEDWPFGAEAARRRPARLGIEYQEIAGQLARFFHVERGRGVLLREVAPGSPAEKAGLKAGDVLMSLDGHEVEDSHDLRRVVGEIDDGREVVAKILREGKALEMKVTLADRRPPEDEPSRRRKTRL